MIGSSDQAFNPTMIESMAKGVLPSPIKDATDSNNNSNKNPRHSSRIAEKYGLRPRTIVKRIQLERRRQEAPVREPRKPRAPPLSKYRRRTANTRERNRMKEINEAFTTLRGILPSFSTRRPTASGMTKITTLKLATSYIQALSDVLTDVGPNNDLMKAASLPTSQLVKEDPSVDFYGSRCSLSSGSDFGDLLSDDSCAFEGNIDAFDDIPPLHEPDPFAILLASDTVGLI